MKTSDEIKKGLKCCLNESKLDFACAECPYDEDGSECGDLFGDALAYIQQLEAELDAAKEFLRSSNHCCESCKHKPGFGYGCTSIAKADGSCWEWRGLPEV